MIASLGGAEIDAKGNRTYAGSGGMVGGLSFVGGNWAYFTGAGKAFNRFTPSPEGFALRQAEPDIIINPDTGGGTNGGGGTTGGGTNGGTTTYNPTTVGYSYTTFNVPNSPYRHLSGITAGGNSLVQALNAIFAQYQAGNITLAQALQQANQLSGYLNNPNVFYQAQHGQDAQALSNFRAQASSIISAITSFIFPSVVTSTENCVGCDTRDTEGVITGAGSSIQSLLASLLGGVSPKTSVEVPPNLYQFNPNQETGANNNMRNILILVVVAVAGWYLYKKYA